MVIGLHGPAHIGVVDIEASVRGPAVVTDGVLMVAAAGAERVLVPLAIQAQLEAVILPDVAAVHANAVIPHVEGEVEVRVIPAHLHQGAAIHRAGELAVGIVDAVDRSRVDGHEAILIPLIQVAVDGGCSIRGFDAFGRAGRGCGDDVGRGRGREGGGWGEGGRRGEGRSGREGGGWRGRGRNMITHDEARAVVGIVVFA